MRGPRFRLSTLMVVVAISAILAWLARSEASRTLLVLAGSVTVGLAVGLGLGIGMDWVIGLYATRDRRD